MFMIIRMQCIYYYLLETAQRRWAIWTQADRWTPEARVAGGNFRYKEWVIKAQCYDKENLKMSSDNNKMHKENVSVMNKNTSMNWESLTPISRRNAGWPRNADRAMQRVWEGETSKCRKDGYRDWVKE